MPGHLDASVLRRPPIREKLPLGDGLIRDLEAFEIKCGVDSLFRHRLRSRF
jgi:hypothetical protein